MQIDVALLPGQKFDPGRCVCVVVDVLRACSSIVTLLERGAESIVAAGDIEDARALARRLPGYVLCGEKDGLPPQGFAYGNSPSEFSRLAFAGRSVILATSNGTRILAALDEAPALLVGCILNRTAAARAAASIARERGLDITVVCSAAYGGSTFVLEDALGAGAIVDAALRLPGPPRALDAARFARDAFLAAGDIGEAVRSAYHAADLVEMGLGDDVDFCGRLDASSVAPAVERGEDGTLVIRGLARGLD
jgi:2-phosphosulfolactate phosphatase